MKINNNNQFIQMFNLHNKPNKTQSENDELHKARKENPELDRALYQSDVAKAYEEMEKVEKVAKKVAKGEPLSKEEQEILNQAGPELLIKAKMAKQEGENLKNRLKNAKSKQEEQSILAQSMSMPNAVAKSDPAYADVLMESIKKVLNDYKTDKFGNKFNYGLKNEAPSMLDSHR